MMSVLPHKIKAVRDRKLKKESHINLSVGATILKKLYINLVKFYQTFGKVENQPTHYWTQTFYSCGTLQWEKISGKHVKL